MYPDNPEKILKFFIFKKIDLFLVIPKVKFFFFCFFRGSLAEKYFFPCRWP